MRKKKLTKWHSGGTIIVDNLRNRYTFRKMEVQREKAHI